MDESLKNLPPPPDSGLAPCHRNGEDRRMTLLAGAGVGGGHSLLFRKVKLLRQLDHDNIIRVLDMFPPLGPDHQEPLRRRRPPH